MSTRWIGRFCLRIARAMASLPCSTASSRRSLENQARILLRARGDLTKPSQSRDGPAPAALEVKTSTVSPLSRVDSSGTRRPLTRAPIVRCPTSVWTAYAKSTGVAPAGSAMTSPLGVKTKTSLRDRSKRSDSRNSPGSSVSFCQSSNCLSHAMSLTASSFLADFGLSVRTLEAPATASCLYFQCAAMPYSARRCMSKVRIWISTGLPLGPMTVVWSDWYMLNLGIAM